MAMAFAPLAILIPLTIEESFVVEKSYPDFNYRLCEFGEVPNIDLFGTRDRIKMSPDRFLCDIGYTLSEDLNEIFKDFKIWLNESNGFWNLEP